MCQYVQRAESHAWFINEYRVIYLETVIMKLYAR